MTTHTIGIYIYGMCKYIYIVYKYENHSMCTIKMENNGREQKKARALKKRRSWQRKKKQPIFFPMKGNKIRLGAQILLLRRNYRCGFDRKKVQEKRNYFHADDLYQVTVASRMAE